MDKDGQSHYMLGVFLLKKSQSSQVWLGDDPETDTFGGPQLRDRRVGVHHSWMVDFMENTIYIWMIWGCPDFRKPPYKNMVHRLVMVGS